MNSTQNTLSAAELAAKYINQTNSSIFLTGKAGTGKTTFLRHIIEHTHKNAIIVAPTGIAAINAGGVTIHSQFGVPFGAFVPDSSYVNSNFDNNINTPVTMLKHLNMREQKRQILKNLELLIIDEVSMLRADLLDVIDFVLKNIRKQMYIPFGGVQVLFIGDLMQLPPVVKDDEWNVLRKYYNSIFFFDAKVLQNQKPLYIELDKIYRQTDTTFIDLLNNLRNNKITQANIDLLNTHYKPNFDATNALNTITITTHNNIADSKNKLALQALKGKSYFYNATVTGDFSEKMFPLDGVLELKVGAQIMFIKNDLSGNKLFFNGKIGVVSKLSDKTIEIDFKDGTPPFEIETYVWKNIKYESDAVTNSIEENTIGEFVHFPIKLAWAITVHKSQGLTFENAILDINRAFAPGQAYVALSRLKSLNGLVLTAPIQFNSIAQDNTLISFASNKADIKTLEHQITNDTKLFLKSTVLATYDFSLLDLSVNKHLNSYQFSESKSPKQHHQAWAKSTFDNVDMLKLNADKFSNQLIQIFNDNTPNYLKSLEDRNASAKNYFHPQLKLLSKALLQKIDALKTEKNIKTFLTELQELELIVFKHIQQLEKTLLLIDSIIYNKTLDKKDFKQATNQLERFEMVKQSFVTISNADSEEELDSKKKRKKTTKEPKETKLKKEKKPDSKLISFDLFKQGKSILHIAQERDMVIGTIEGHLAHYVSLGLLPVTQLVNASKHEAILEAYKKHEGENKLAHLKEVLGDEYSFSEIKFSMATQKLLTTK